MIRPQRHTGEPPGSTFTLTDAGEALLWEHDVRRGAGE
jgi:hypothetical protein